MDRPENVVYAVIMLWTALAIYLLSFVCSVLDPANPYHFPESLPWNAYCLATFVIMALLIFKIRAGANWARIICVLLQIGFCLVEGLTWAVASLFHNSAMDALAVLRVIAALILPWPTAILLFSKSANAWFKAERKAS